MPFLFRAVKKNRWDLEESSDWVAEGDVPADWITDLKTSNNTLSVWLVDDEKTNLERIIAAFATTRDRIAQVEYILFDPKLLIPIDIEIQKIHGNSADEGANDFHHDLVKLSGTKLINLAKMIAENCEFVRVYPKEVLQLIRASVDAGKIDKRGLPKEILKEIEQA